MNSDLRSAPKPQRVLIIAGSDCSGGAGIQADIKTVTCLGGYAMSAITALTVQNTLGVSAVQEIGVPFVMAQIEACLEDIGADVIKTGMIASPELIEALAQRLRHAKGIKTVIDPVMVAKGGHDLSSEAARDALISHLIPLADLLTPNIPEAERLTGIVIEDEKGQRRAAEALMGLGAKAVLLKGGHATGDEVVDLLLTPDEAVVFRSKRRHTHHTHGTGCSLASACATLMTPERRLAEVVDKARAYILAAIDHAPGLGRGHGPLGHSLGHSLGHTPKP